MAGGRPSDFTPEIAKTICERLVGGESLRDMCEDEDLPSARTVHRWIVENEEFRQQYTHAREAQAETIFDEILDIADDGRNDWMVRRGRGDEDMGWKENGEAISRSRLRVDARKWMASKLAPKKYGEKAALTGGGPDDDPIRTRPDLSGLSEDQLRLLATIAAG